MVSFLIHAFDAILPLLVNVAFVTLLERKILGLSQLRRGPNKVAAGGVLQPFGDAIKLFTNEPVSPAMTNKAIYYAAPAGALMLALVLWTVKPGTSASGVLLGGLLVLSALSLGVYPLFFSGWASNSKFAQLGAMRGIAQTVSYEISLGLILFSVFFFHGGLTLSPAEVTGLQDTNVLAPLLVVWLITCVAETNRTPFDFAEGESELVSGFNVEYGSGGFAIIFMAEYASILFFSAATSSLFFGARAEGLESVITVFLSGWWIWLRATFPRYRYDKLLSLAWKSLLPLALSLSIFYPTWVTCL